MAERDLRVAQVIVAGDLLSYEGASFHAQQAVEMALKALLTRHQVEFRRTHDLGELRELAEPVAPGVSAALTGVEVLTPHAVETHHVLEGVGAAPGPGPSALRVGGPAAACATPSGAARGLTGLRSVM